MTKIFTNNDDDTYLLYPIFEDMESNGTLIQSVIENSGALKWGKMIGHIENQADLMDIIESVEEHIKQSTTAVFRYKGTVASEDYLPSEDNTVGDCYNVTDSGANYAWNGTSWDKLSEAIPYLIGWNTL